MKRWIAMLLIAALTLALFCGCKTEEPEYFIAETDDLISAETAPENKEPEKEEEEAPSSETKEPEPEKEEEKPEEEEPKEEEPPAEEEAPQEETPSAPQAVEKETSGVAITFLVQNLKDSYKQRAFPNEQERGSNSLYRRAHRFSAQAKAQDPDVILCNEANAGWIEFLNNDQYLKSNYEMVYKYDEAGVNGCGYTTVFGYETRLFTNDNNDMSSPILYKRSRFELMDSGHFWYSETPDRASNYEKDMAEYFQICTWVQLKEKSSGEVLFAYSSRIENQGSYVEAVPTKSLNQLFDTAGQHSDSAYVFMGGTFNVDYRDSVYSACVDHKRAIDLKDMALNMKAVGIAKVENTGGTVCIAYEDGDSENFHPENSRFSSMQLDHLMAKPHPHMAVDYWGVDRNRYKNNDVNAGYISDHYGLVVKVRIGTKADYSQYQVEH